MNIELEIVGNNLSQSTEITSLVANRGFLYGDGFFESMNWKKDRILFQEEHQKRLNQSLELLSLKQNQWTNLDFVTSEIAKNVKPEQDYRLKICVFRNSDGFYLPNENETSIRLFLIEFEQKYEPQLVGLSASIYLDQAKAAGKFSNIKSLSSLLYIQASIDAKQKNLDDNLIINTDRNIIEGSNSNVIFVMNDNSIVSPPVEDGSINGVMRQLILFHAPKAGYNIFEKSISIQDVANIKECWICNISRGLRWIKSIDNKQLTNEKYMEFYNKIIPYLV
jgi:branched-chain amino acid aminotransferase